jgi:tripartite ATP-independent transporter DctP family solute receptor
MKTVERKLIARLLLALPGKAADKETPVIEAFTPEFIVTLKRKANDHTSANPNQGTDRNWIRTTCNTGGVITGARKFMLLPVISVLLLPCGCRRAEDPPKVIMKVAQVLPETHPTNMAMRFFKQRAEELAGPGLEVRLYPSGQIGATNSAIDLCRLGNVEAAVVSTAPLASYVTELTALTMPFVFRDSAHQKAVLEGPAAGLINEVLARRGLAAATFFDAGTRNIMTKRGPVRSRDDLAGLKIRVMDSAPLQQAVERLGAAAIPMNQAEVYGALQTGMIDGWENNPTTCLAFSMHETGCIHFSWTRHCAIPDVLLLSKRWLDGIDPAMRDAVLTAAAETGDYQRRLWKLHEDDAIATLQKAGMVFHEVDGETFRSAFDGFHEPYRKRYGPEFSELLEHIISR